jgi:adenine deaminase
VTDLPYYTPSVRVHHFQAQLPDPRELRIEEQGTARVIGVQEGQILTDSLYREVEGHLLPDLERDLLKVVVCSRYRQGRYSVGLVHGMGLTGGAIASSVAHDSHNLVAVGVEDAAILTALSEVSRTNGGLALAGEDTILSLPLVCAGLMSADSYPAVAGRLNTLEERAGALGAIPHPFMVLSFLTLTVIPSLRITECGLYDVPAGRVVPLFVPL